MNTELAPEVENEEDTKPEATPKCACMELGVVSKDTHGFGTTFWDGGIGQQW